MINALGSKHMQKNPTIPVVMTFSGSDPTGGAGIQADIETLFGLGCHCTAVVTAITAQDTTSLKDYTPTPTYLVIEQARAVLNETAVDAFKIGIIGNLDNLVAIYTIIKEHPTIPVVLVITPGAVGTLENPDIEMVNAFTTLLCPISTLLVIDKKAAQILAPGADTVDAYAQKIMETGCQYVLIKNCHEMPDTVENTLYGNHRRLETFTWERIPGNYHGCGCTLTAALTGLLGHKIDLMEAVIEAQKYTWDCIKKGIRFGTGSQLPNRLFWAKNGQSR